MKGEAFGKMSVGRFFGMIILEWLETQPDMMCPDIRMCRRELGIATEDFDEALTWLADRNLIITEQRVVPKEQPE